MDQTPSKLKPRISINLPTYNRAHYLPVAIDSVLAQSFTNWELIIVDDASSDQTQAILKPYLIDPRIHYFKNETNLGIGQTRNKALSLSQSEYVSILDSDDYWLDHFKLEKQLNFLDNHSDHVLVGTGVIEKDQDNQEIKRYLLPETDQKIREIILKKNPFAHASVLYRRQVVTEVENYSTNLDGIEDYDLWLRLGNQGKFHNLPIYALGYRRHPGNISQTDRLRLMKSNLILIKKYRASYPNFYQAWFRRCCRLNIARLFIGLRINF